MTLGLAFITFGIFMLCFAITIDIINILEAKKKTKKEEDYEYEMDWKAFAEGIRKWKEAYYYRGQ